jgi:uncharacterized protein (TIGR02145 family)
VIIMFAACKKDSAPAPVTDESSTSDIITFDNDPGKYTAIKISKQVWVQQNLAVSRYRNGDKIPQVKDAAKWAALTTGAWCWYTNDSATGAVYGKLYNWYAVNDPRGLAPTGWHVPSDAEWDTLSTHLGNNAGGKLKDTGTIEAGTGLWYAPNAGATNKTGFTGLPGGHRLSTGSFFHIGNYANWWSSTQVDTTNAWNRTLTYLNGNVARSYHYLQNGFSVRCLKD